MIYLIGIGDLGIPTEYIFTMIGAKTGADFIVNHDDYVSEEINKILKSVSEESLKEISEKLGIPLEFAYTIWQMGNGARNVNEMPNRHKKYLVNFYGRSRVAHNPNYWINQINEFVEKHKDKKIILINVKSAIEIRNIYTQDTVLLRLIITDGNYGHFDGEDYNYFEKNQAIYNEFRFFHSSDATLICNNLTLEETITKSVSLYSELRSLK